MSRQVLPLAWTRTCPAQAAAAARCGDRVDDRLMTWHWAPGPRELSAGLAGEPSTRKGRLDDGARGSGTYGWVDWHRGHTGR